METINILFNFLFDTLLLPFVGMSPIYGLIIISAITGILMLMVFRYTSDQKGIKRTKNLVKAHFLAIRLYKDDISQMVSTMKNILVSNLLYMSKSIKPMAFMLIPVGLVLIQLDSRYEHRAFRVGESAIVTILLVPDAAASSGSLRLLDDLSLQVPAGIKIETPALRIASRAEACWRIRMEQEGSYDLSVRAAGRAYGKRIEVSDELTALATKKERAGFWTTLFSPAETSLPPDAPIQSIVIGYPKRMLSLGGISLHWLVGFFVLSLVAGFSLKGVFRVEI